MRRFISLFLSFILLFFSLTTHAASSAALGYQPKYLSNFTHFDYVNPDAPKGGELVLYSIGNFDSFNPFLLKGIDASGISPLTLESMMVKNLDEPFSIYNLLAKDIRLAKDKLSVTFKLNPDARFSDGSEVTTEDIKFSFDTLKSELAHPQYRLYWNDIQEAEIINKHTIRFKFAKVNPELHLITAEIPVFSKAAIGDKPFDKIVTEPLLGTGPYVIDKYKLGKYVTYKRNPNYWAKELNTRKGMFNFDLITIKYYKDSSVALEALKSGEFDFMAVYNSKEWAREYVGPQFDKGDIIKQEMPHKNNAGMQGFVFNLRRPLFQDLRVRKAINLAFDFPWANKNLFYDQYERCNSYFSNSELSASKSLPEGDELTLLKEMQQRFPDDFPQSVLTEVWQPVSTLPPHSLRNNLRQAKKLLDDAGFTLKNGVLENEAGVKLEIEVILMQKAFERILAPFERNLAKLGIKLKYRTVDVSLYQRRQESYDFDMTVTVFGQSQSPGNELMTTWHSSSADKQGMQNLMGLKHPVVDALIEKVIYAPNREALKTAVHALDRVMLHGEYVVPNWYVGTHRIAYWDKFGMPEQLPLYYTITDWMLQSWWLKSSDNLAEKVVSTED